MTRKDYTAFARVLRDQYERQDTTAARLAIEEVARDMARVFKADNGRFDRERFLDAAIPAAD